MDIQQLPEFSGAHCCGVCSRIMLESETALVDGDQQTFISCLRRLFGIEEHEMLDTGSLSHFCSDCNERLQHLLQLFHQLDAVTADIAQVRCVVEGILLNRERTHEEENPFSLRLMLSARINAFDQKSTETGIPNEAALPCLEVETLFSEEDFFEPTFTIEPEFSEVVETCPSTMSVTTASDNENKADQGTAKVSFVGTPVIRDIRVLVERLSAKTLSKYQKLSQVKVRKRGRNKSDKIDEMMGTRECDRFKCPYNCRRKSGFASKSALIAHIERIHEGTTHPFKCRECGRKFTQPKQLTVHQKTHEGEFPHYCRFCGRGCLNNYTLRLHESKHTGESFYKCKLCPKSYKNHGGLIYHNRIEHTKEKPFTCDVCGKSFVNNGKLKRHVDSVHRNERNFVCELCGKSFKIRNYLYMHMRYHEGNLFPSTKLSKAAMMNRQRAIPGASPSSQMDNVDQDEQFREVINLEKDAEVS